MALRTWQRLRIRIALERWCPARSRSFQFVPRGQQQIQRMHVPFRVQAGQHGKKGTVADDRLRILFALRVGCSGFIRQAVEVNQQGGTR